MTNKVLLIVLVLSLTFLTGCSGKNAVNSIPSEVNIQKSASQESISYPQISENYMKNDSWDLKIEKVEMFHVPDSSTKTETTYIILSNLKGKDKAMTLAGEITAVIGTSGKVYSNNPENKSLSEWYENSKQLRKENSQKNGVLYEEGVFKLAVAAIVDTAETGISALIYTDKNGGEHKIPVSLETTIKVPSPDAK